MLRGRRVLASAFVLDGLITAAAYLVAFRLRFLSGPLPLYNWLPFLRILPAFVLLSLVSHALFGVFQEHSGEDEAQANVITATFLNLLLTMALSYFVDGFAVPRSVLLLAAVLQGGALILILRRRVRHWRKERRPLYDTAGINEGAFLQAIAVQAVEVSPDVSDVMLAAGRLVRGENDEFRLLIPQVGLVGVEALEKRLFDLGCLLLLAPVALPLLPVIALAVLVFSGRPVLYSQERVGYGGRPFRMWKFRTMRVGAEEGWGPRLATRDDPRVTPIGRWLRPLRLDELPQLWNVLLGEMSFVGPRPERPEFVAEFLAEIPYYALRLRVKPGLTGLAQLYGSYDLDVREKLKYDLYYLLHYSPALDLLLLLRTLAVPLQPRKAAGQAAESGRAAEHPVYPGRSAGQ